jgi:hypothetical protein
LAKYTLVVTCKVLTDAIDAVNKLKSFVSPELRNGKAHGARKEFAPKAKKVPSNPMNTAKTEQNAMTTTSPKLATTIGVLRMLCLCWLFLGSLSSTTSTLIKIASMFAGNTDHLNRSSQSFTLKFNPTPRSLQ